MIESAQTPGRMQLLMTFQDTICATHLLTYIQAVRLMLPVCCARVAPHRKVGVGWLRGAVSEAARLKGVQVVQAISWHLKQGQLLLNRQRCVQQTGVEQASCGDHTEMTNKSVQLLAQPGKQAATVSR